MVRAIIALACFLLFALATSVQADTVIYRDTAAPPTPPSPGISGTPPAAPNPPCITDIDIGVFNVDCRPALSWIAANGGWSTDQVQHTNSWLGNVSYWTSNDFAEWRSNFEESYGIEEIRFSGAGTSATIHVHDYLPDNLHDNVTFTIHGGPAGATWICKHICTIPDTDFVVSLDPLDISVNKHFEYFPAIPPIKGGILVSFS